MSRLEEDPEVWQQLVVEEEDAHSLESAASAPEPEHGNNEVLDPDARREEQTRRDVDGDCEHGGGAGPGGVVAPEDGTDAKGHLYEGAEPMHRYDRRRVGVRLSGGPGRGEALALRACDGPALCNVHDAPRIAVEEEEGDRERAVDRLRDKVELVLVMVGEALRGNAAWVDETQ